VPRDNHGFILPARTVATLEGTIWPSGPPSTDRYLTGDLSGVGALSARLPAARYREPQASFLAWIDCRELGLGDDPAAEFLSRGRVALSPGPDFGSQGRGFARLSIGTSPELIAEAVREWPPQRPDVGSAVPLPWHTLLCHDQSAPFPGNAGRSTPQIPYRR
jgi:hypothetical protein